MILVEQAQELIREAISPVATETIALSEALGRVLATTTLARISHPPEDVSAMDGYAVRISDITSTPIQLEVVGESAAGHPYHRALESGHAVRIFTGATVPSGADTVVIQEDTESNGKSVKVNRIEPHRHIRPKGQDFLQGNSVLEAPARLEARHIGLLAAADLPWIQVYQQPRIGVLSTGDEIVLPGEPRTAAQIVSANGPGLCAFICNHGGIPVNLGVVGDNIETLQDAAAAASRCDLLVTSGGVSVGDHDLVLKALSELGLTVAFHGISMRPGKPLMFGHLHNTALLGLPGNPVSAMVCALLFLLPALDRLQGLPGHPPETSLATLSVDLPENGGRQDYQRAFTKLDDRGRLTVRPFDKQDSSMIGALAQSNALIVRSPRASAAIQGDTVQVIMLKRLL